MQWLEGISIVLPEKLTAKVDDEPHEDEDEEQ